MKNYRLKFLLVITWVKLATAFPPSYHEPDCNLEGCVCGNDYDPVCATNGKTYTNICLMSCASAADPTIQFCSGGPCPQHGADTCHCPFDPAPVCGNDKNTYLNECFFACAQAKNRHLKKSHDGECQTPTAITCSSVTNLVCATNRKTYMNRCYLNQAALSEEHDESFGLAYPGSFHGFDLIFFILILLTTNQN